MSNNFANIENGELKTDLHTKSDDPVENYFIQHYHSMKNLGIITIERVFGKVIYRKTI